MRRRTATTLIEVLVAIFVMAIGLLALLTLFPLGALSMAQAIKDDRTAQAAASAEAIALVRGFRNDPRLFIAGDQFVNPSPPGTTPGQVPAALADGPSYPIYIDPIGTQSFVSPFNSWVGGRAPGIPRFTVNFLASPPLAPTVARQQTLQWFTLLDDITFYPQGVAGGQNLRVAGAEIVPAAGQSLVVLREGRYSWAYLVRRPRSSVPSVVELTIVVYSQRPLNVTSSLVPSGETTYAAQVIPNTTNAITLTPIPGQEKPVVRKGDWILDASISPNQAQILLHGPVHGYFYRVVDVTDVAGGVALELQTNLKADVNRVVVMEGVVEVFEKGPGSAP